MTGIPVFTSRLRNVLAIVTTMLLAMSWAPATLAQGSNDTSYEFDTGETVSWDSPWEFGSDDEAEGIQYLSIGSQYGLIEFYTVLGAISIEDIRDIIMDEWFDVLDGYATLDRGSYDDITYSLDLVSLDDVEYGMFMTVRAGSGSTPSFTTLFAAPVPVFASEFSGAQQAVQVDGSGVFQGVGGQGLQDLLEANTGTATNVPAGDDADDSDESDSAEDGSDSTDGGDAADNDSDGDNEERFTEVWNAPGTAIHVSWTEDWDSASEGGLLTLSRSDFQTSLICQVVEDPNASVDSVLTELENILGDTLDSNGGGIEESETSDDRVMVTGSTPDGFYALEAIGVGDGDRYVRCVFSSVESDTESAITLFTETVLLDDEPPLSMSSQHSGGTTGDPDMADDESESVDDGSDAADDELDGGPKFGGSNSDDEEETPETDEPAGDDGDDTSTGDGESFAGSAFGVEFTWDSEWTINENLDTPVIDGEDGLDSVALTRTSDELGLLTLTVFAEVEPGVDGLVEYWQTDDFLTQTIASPDGGVLLADSDGDTGAVVFIDYLDDGTQIVIYREAWYLESEQAYVTIVLTTIPAHLESSLDAAMDGVTVDGEPVLTYFSYDDIIDAAGEDPENTI